MGRFRRRRSALLVGIPLAGLSALSPGAEASAPAACRAAAAAGSARVSLASGGRARWAILHVPPAPAHKRLPLVLALHGSASNGAFMERYSGLSAVADRAGFVAVYPSSAGAWNSDGSRPGAPDDVGFVSDLLDVVSSRTCIDGRRVYATGVSSGASMTARLGCDLSGRIAAIAPVAGNYAGLPACRPDRPVSVLEIHGTGDRIVPYGGRGPRSVGSVPAYLSAWRRRDRCDPGLTTRRLAPLALETDTRGCAAGAAVRQIVIVGGGHQYPGANPPDAGPRSGISAAAEAWRFFAAKRLAPAGARR